MLLTAVVSSPAAPPPGGSPVQTEDVADVSPAPDKSKFSKVSFLRIWYFGAPDSQRITVASRLPSGEAKVLGSAIRADRMLGYRALKPGSYNLNILDGSIVPDANGKLPEGGKTLGSFSLNLVPGSFNTVVLKNTAGRVATEVLTDEAPSDGSGPQVRILDLLASKGAKVFLSVGTKKREIWSSGGPAATGEVSLSGVSSPARFEFGRQGPNGFLATNSFEMTLSPLSGYSLVVYSDRYGHDAMAVLENATANVSAEELKELAQ